MTSSAESWFAVQVDRALEAGEDAVLTELAGTALASLCDLRERAERIAQLRAAKGQPMSKAMRQSLTAIVDRIEPLTALIEESKQ